ncbi:putative methanogenesis marker protein 1 [Luteitalea pratensis]|uniref:Putative methanogenesis marker protein 1 n=2 Tax=Luteitalea pratensis TaxID=1855912 RepID=A0A143PIS8_LUTPR|nr:putative methanogenesis marker protein 1 [Luteitalea pratensis]
MNVIGVTRLADVTGLDHVGIPVWAAVRPIADESSISVQNGKGPTRIHARAGAMMEAVEHYCCERPPHRPRYASFRTLRRHARALDPESLGLDPSAEYADTLPLEWLRGTDLIAGEQVWLPACAVLKPRREDGTPVIRGSTNGLASGNTIEEAVCHGLAEVIERDAWTLAIIRGVLVPRVRVIAAAVSAGVACHLSRIHDARPEGQLFPVIAVSTLPEVASRLAGRFRAAGIRLVIREITTDVRVPTFLAAGWEPPGTGRPHFYSGLGAHPDSRVAMTRALTELAQSRLTVFQGVREDIDKIARLDGDADRPEQSLWLADGPEKSFDAVHTYRSRDILEDIRFMSQQLRSVGLEQVIAVDLTRSEVGFPVVKIVVPGLEHWAARHFDPDLVVLGSRARRYLA